MLIHSGSRGLGHQVCTDYVKRMDTAIARYKIVLPDRELACAPLSSPEGRDYMAAMACAANFAWANRQAIAHRVREAAGNALGAAVAEGTRQVYDVAHNVAKLETYGGRRGLRPPQGGDPRLPSGLGRDPRRLPRHRPAGLHPRQHGHEQLRAEGDARLDGALLRLRLPRGGAADEPHRRPPPDHRRRAAPRAGSRGNRRALPVPARARRGGALRLQGRRAGGRRRRAGRARGAGCPGCGRSASSRAEALRRRGQRGRARRPPRPARTRAGGR